MSFVVGETTAGDSNVLYVFDPAINKLTRVAATVKPDSLMASPDGNYLIFESAGFHLFDLNTLSVHSIAGLQQTGQVLWSPNSTCLLFVSSQYLGVYRLTDGAQSAWQANGLGHLQGSSAGSIVAVSSDGKWLAFQCDKFDLCISEIFGEQHFSVPNNVDARLDYPLWLPDSKRLAYLGFSHSTASHIPDSIGIYDIEKQITVAFWSYKGEGLLNLTLSPDGEYAAVLRTEKNIAIVELGSGRVLSSNAAGDYNRSPTWSPDGKQIAFVSQPNNPNSFEGIYIVNVDGTNMQRLTKDYLGKFIEKLIWLP